MLLNRQGDDLVDAVVLGQQFQSDGGLDLEAEIAEPPQGQQIGVAVQGGHGHGSCATPKPILMAIEVATHDVGGGPHFHQIGKVAGITAHLGIAAKAQGGMTASLARLNPGIGSLISQGGRNQRGQGKGHPRVERSPKGGLEGLGLGNQGSEAGAILWDRIGPRDCRPIRRHTEVDQAADHIFHDPIWSGGAGGDADPDRAIGKKGGHHL